VLKIADLRVGELCDENVRQVILRLNQVELSSVLVVVVGNVLVGNVDLGSDLLVQDFFAGQAAAQILFEIFQGDLLVFQSLVKLLLRVGRLDLGELALDFLIRGK